ncbi:FERM domain-containing protein 5-like [Convolutriloba macropyga]|uniref:FERM domain-containing protein 5-like n=1 Tax=Convolutriloba macropyga TaxID=536237 RepID=UPI003F5201F3
MALRAATYPTIEVNGKRYQNSNTDMEPVYKCSVKYIDDNDNGDFTFGKEHLGYKLLYDVCLKLNVIETDYFGLRFVDKTGQRHWLNPMKPITKQLGMSQPPYLLCFRVKYYPRDLSIIQEEITRYQLFLQVKRDLEHGRLLSTRSEAALLCAYVLQATLGSYDERDLPPGYSQEMKLAAAYKDNEFFDEVEQYHKVKMK